MRRPAKENTLEDVEGIVRKAEQEGVTMIRFAYCDLGGVTRCKAVHVSQLASKLVEGVSLSRAQMSMNILDELADVDEMTPVGEIRLVPDLETFTVSPWVAETATVLCNQVDHDRTDWGACPRAFLADTLDLLAEQGISVRASVEAEFYLVGDIDGEPAMLPRKPVYSVIGHDAHAAVLLDVVHVLTDQGKEVEQAINEYGPGQQEVVIRHQPALTAADDFLTLKDVIRGVSRRHGYVASFAPKPYLDQMGSGAHMHLSLWDGNGRNLLHDPEASQGLSDLGRGFIAGLREHLRALVALTSPSVNSYHRLTAGAWASSTNAWGFDNREAAIRVASPFYGREAQTYNIEYKPMDAAANPYLAFGSILRAGLDGVERGLSLPAPALVDPAKLSAEERSSAGIRDLPANLGAALDELATDSVLVDALGPLLYRAFQAVRRSELAAFAEQSVEEQLAAHLYKY